MFVIILINVALVHLSSGAWVREMENHALYQGDIVLRPDQREALKNGNSAFGSIIGFRWPNGVIPYVVDWTVGANGQQAITAAIADYHQFTCLQFVQRTNQQHYIKFQNGQGCSSPVGYNNPEFTNNGINIVTLENGCRTKGIVMHEIGHSIGLYHEQSRPDRDTYVQILSHNVFDPAMVFNFNRLPVTKINSLQTNYDYLSMMHYGKQAFGCDDNWQNCQDTIRTIDANKQNVIGQRNGFSQGDIDQIKLMYNCPNGNDPCVNKDSRCSQWANAGECENNPTWMWANCKKICTEVSGDKDTNCAAWANSGECQSNPTWMLVNCKKSCNVC